MKEFIQKLGDQQHLTREEAARMMRKIMEGDATDAQIAGLLMALNCKGEHIDELLGFVEVMREKSIKIHIEDPNAIDMCGTGGDGSGTFNISTVSSFVVAGAGVTVAKHGNRSVSSACGSADVLKTLGVNIEIDPEEVAACINSVGIGFLFAPMFHPAMKFAAKPRTDLGIKTCFNLLGPMTNPAGVRRQLVGAFNQAAAEKMAFVFHELGAKKVFVVSSKGDLDEISLHTHTAVYEVKEGNSVEQYDIDPSVFNLPLTHPSEIQGGSAHRNASIAMDVLKKESIPHRNYVLANAAFGLMAADNAQTIDEAICIAKESIDSGRALQKLNDLIAFTNQ